METIPDLDLAEDSGVVLAREPEEAEEETGDLTNSPEFTWPAFPCSWTDFLPSLLADGYRAGLEELPSLLTIIDGNNVINNHGATIITILADVSESLPNGGSEFWFNFVFSWWFAGDRMRRQ
jgi:hypothetical protein